MSEQTVDSLGAAENDSNNTPLTPFYITDVLLNGIGCFKSGETGFSFSHQEDNTHGFNIILGDNGTGKTTILKAIAETFRLFGQGYDFKLKFSGIEVVKEHEKPSIATGSSAVMGRYIINPFIDSNTAQDFLSRNYEPNISPIIYVKTTTALELSDIRKKYADYSALTSDLITYGSNRNAMSSKLVNTDEISSLDSILRNDSRLLNAEEWFLQTYLQKQNAEGTDKAFFERQFEQVKETLLSILPDGLVTDIRIRPVTREQPQPAVVVDTVDGMVRITELSHGYQTVIAWMTDLAARMFEQYPDSDDPLKEPGIVLVDELDLHLHPRWQRRIVKDLKRLFPKVQFIVTTHSPEIIQSDEDINVILLKRDEESDQITAKQLDQNFYGMAVDEILESEAFDSSAYNEDISALLEEHQAVVQSGDTKRKQEIEAELKCLNPNAFSYFDIDNLIDQITD